jgi:hypothetical protein
LNILFVLVDILSSTWLIRCNNNPAISLRSTESHRFRRENIKGDMQGFSIWLYLYIMNIKNTEILNRR